MQRNSKGPMACDTTSNPFVFTGQNILDYHTSIVNTFYAWSML